MKKLLSVLSILVLLAGLLAVGACSTQSTNTPAQNVQAVALDAANALPQIAGVAASVADILQKSPVGATEGGQSAAAWANAVASTATNVQQGIASKDQIAGTYTALVNSVASLPLDSATKAALSPYLGWGAVAAQVLDLAVGAIKGAQAPAANPTSLLLLPGRARQAACSNCHSQIMACFGFTSRHGLAA